MVGGVGHDVIADYGLGAAMAVGQGVAAGAQ